MRSQKKKSSREDALKVPKSLLKAFLDETRGLEAYAVRATFAIKSALAGQKTYLQSLGMETVLRYKLEHSQSYMVFEDRPERVFKMLEEEVANGRRGLCITRQHPKQVRRRHPLKNVQLFWLTEAKEENTINDLIEISHLIAGFVNSSENGIVLLDGLEYLVSRNGFEAVYQFIQNKRNQVAAAEAILITPVHPRAFSEEKLALLERELKPV